METGDDSGVSRALPDRAVDDLDLEATAASLLQRLFGRSSPPRIGRYAIQRRLGMGGMGRVYKAHDAKLERAVAIKLIGLDPQQDEARDLYERRLRAEARALARLTHPNVVEVFEVGSFGPDTFVVMEYVEGLSFNQWLAATDRSWRERLDVLLQVGAGLAAAHDAGIVHGDVKPSNILVGADERVRMVDFGLARSHSAEAMAPVPGDVPFPGTPGYLAPECVRGAPGGPASDQFSFCVVLHEALTGLRAPIAEGSPGADGVPAWVLARVRRGLSDAPEDRWPSMAALLGALARDPSQRRRGVAAVGVVVLVAAAGWSGHRLLIMHREQQCQREGEAIATTWNDGAREHSRDAMLASGSPIADSTHPRVVAVLDGWAERWAATARETCTRARIEGSLDAAHARRVTVCLARAQAAASVFVELLAEADADLVHAAVVAASGLPPSEACLRHSMDPPTADDAVDEEIHLRLIRTDVLRSAGRFGDARGEAETARAAADAAGATAAAIEAQTQLGRILQELSEDDAARRTLEDAFFGAQAIGRDDLAATAAVSLVGLAHKAVDFEGAHAWGRMAGSLLDRLGEDRSSRRADLLTHLALVHEVEGDPDQAAQMHQRALEMWRDSVGAAHPSVAIALAGIGNAKFAAGDFDAAARHYAQARDLSERVLGPDHPTVAACIDNIGSVHLRRNELDAASESYARSLELRTRAFGPDHRTVATTRFNLGGVHFARGEFERAEADYAAALAIYENRDGPDHVNVADVLLNLAGAVVQRGNLDQAMAHMTRAIGILERSLGPENPRLIRPLVNLTMLHRVAGDPQRAAAVLDRALAIARAAISPEDPLWVLLNQMSGNVAADRGDRRAALEAYRRAAQQSRDIYGPDHPRTAEIEGQIDAEQVKARTSGSTSRRSGR